MSDRYAPFPFFPPIGSRFGGEQSYMIPVLIRTNPLDGLGEDHNRNFVFSGQCLRRVIWCKPHDELLARVASL